MSSATTAGMVFGYARVSTNQQDEALQLDALGAACCDRVFVDKLSGNIGERPALDELLGQLRAGDILVVWRLDHQIIGPGGVFLLDSKNWFGDVTVEAGAATVTARDDPDDRTAPVDHSIGSRLGTVRDPTRTGETLLSLKSERADGRPSADAGARLR